MDYMQSALLNLLDAENAARRAKVRRAWNYYHGRHKDQLKITDGIDDNVHLNLCRMVVDHGSAGLWGNGNLPIIVRDKKGKEVNLKAQEHWDNTWEDNNGPSMLIEMGQQGSVSGDLFIRVYPDEQGTKYYIWDSECVLVECDPNDHKHVLSYIYETQATVNIQGKRTIVKRRQTVERSEAGGWTIIDEEAVGSAPYRQIGETEFWNHSFDPVLHCQNSPSDGEINGISDIEPEVIDLNDQINLQYSNIAKIVRLFAHPRIIGKALGEFVPPSDAGIENMIMLSSPDASIEVLRFQADLKGAHDYLDRLQKQFWAITRIPDLKPGSLDGLGYITGVALEIMYRPFMAKIEVKRNTYGPLLISMVKGALELGGFDTDELSIEIRWPDVIPVDMGARAETAIKMQDAGFSRSSAIRYMDGDPAYEAREREKEIKAQLEIEQQRMQMQDDIFDDEPPKEQDPPGRPKGKDKEEDK